MNQITAPKRKPSLDTVQAIIKRAGCSSRVHSKREWQFGSRESSVPSLAGPSAKWLIFTVSRNQLLLLAKSGQTLNKPCLRTRYDPEYTKTTLALKQFSTGLVGEADNY